MVQTWDEHYNYVSDFLEKNDRYPLKEEESGWWIINQRKYYHKTKQGTITPEQITRLEQLKYWSWDPKATEWMDKAKYIRDYVIANNKYPREAHAYYGNLFRWSGVQRTQYNTNKSVYSDEQVKMLESIPRWPLSC